MNTRCTLVDAPSDFVRFNNDGWINATDVAKRFGKRPADWLKQDETKQYLSALAEALSCDPESLLETRRGRYHSGTWLHPKVAVAFARWLDLQAKADSLVNSDLVNTQVNKETLVTERSAVEAQDTASPGQASKSSMQGGLCIAIV